MDIMMVNRLKNLKNALIILEGEFNDNDSVIQYNLASIQDMFAEISDTCLSLKCTLQEQRSATMSLSEKVNVLRQLRLRVQYMSNNLPKKYSIDVDKTENYPSEVPCDNSSNIPPSTHPANMSQFTQFVSPDICRGSKSVHQKPLSLDIGLVKYVTEAEMNIVPKYMKGRTNVITINEFVDEFNVALKKKYTILRQPRKTLKKKEMEMQVEWKRDENSQPKGTFFITSKDLTNLTSCKADKTTSNLIIILKHLKKIREFRKPPGCIHLIVQNG